MTTTTTHSQEWPVGTQHRTASRSGPLTVALWVVSVAAAGMFLMAGWPKLAGDAQMVQVFDAIGVGQWFRYLTGGLEVVSALALLVPPVAFYGAVALAATMVGAVFTHLVIVGGSPAVAATLLAATSFIAWARWSRR